ncbi:DUF3237 domain-containing protein [Mycobacterium sp. shizuoka-1]|uniref:DUF3237 domain-containing protein n=1 Tax=Mycobacterium sp. shizuoka-1 TaxID=2039281 RepID=UPI000C062D5E|nr:DUF3237 domain-containing protein [Mycobacterium sp. shizuoka-1]GAY17293.1 UPF0311 protein [Mycobacterium sp. shizuoka-1]
MTLVDIDAEPRFAHLLDMRVAFDPAQVFATPTGTRMTFVIREGRCEGARIAGDLLAGGGDWVVIGTDGVARLDVRATLRTDDGAYVHVTVTGRVQMSPEATARYTTGELIRHDEIYARSSPLFDTDDERYRWINAVHTVAINQMSMSEVHYRVFEVV